MNVLVMLRVMVKPLLLLLLHLHLHWCSDVLSFQKALCAVVLCDGFGVCKLVSITCYHPCAATTQPKSNNTTTTWRKRRL